VHAGKAASSWTVHGLFNNDGGRPPTPRSWRCAQARSAMPGRIEHAGEGGLQLDAG
jgi:filamentous hemagglutinin